MTRRPGWWCWCCVVGGLIGVPLGWWLAAVLR